MGWNDTELYFWYIQIKLDSFSFLFTWSVELRSIVSDECFTKLTRRVGCFVHKSFHLVFCLFFIGQRMSHLLASWHWTWQWTWRQKHNLVKADEQCAPPLCLRIVVAFTWKGVMHTTSIACTLRRPKFSIAKCRICNYTIIIWLMHLNITKQ